MNYKMIFSTIGQVLRIEAVLMLIPVLTSVIAVEWKTALIFAATALGTYALGFGATLLFKPKNQIIFAKEGFVTVALAWIAVSLAGTVPFLVSGEIPSFVDAFFETVSGFTTTGASVLTEESLSAMSKGMLMWRSFTHWIGGMGVLVFVLAIMSRAPERSMHILRAEMPGPIVDKLVPRAKNTSLILYVIYIAMTVILMVFLLAGGVSVFESAIYAFGTAGTGGFGIYANSIAGYTPYVKWVLTVFMILFGVNFNLYYLLIMRRVSTALKSREFWVYAGIIVASTGLIFWNVYPLYQNASDAICDSAFQVASFMTTTGYSTVNYDAWPALSKAILFALMFIGGCAGSTAGGFKVSRAMILVKKCKNDLMSVINPRRVSVVKFEGRCLDKETVNGVGSYLLVYMLVIAAVFLLVSFDPNVAALAQSGVSAFETNMTATVSCFNNIGPAFSGAAAGYAAYTPLSKIVLSLAMLLGRLEIYPILLTLHVGTWLKK